MLNENFVYVGLVIGVWGGISYIIDTVKGKIQPNKVSYFLWATASLIGFAAQLSKGVGVQSLLTFSVGFIPLLVFISSFVNKDANWKITRFDLLCGTLSFGGLILWGVTREGDIAIFFSILADALACLPTLIKSYKYPETESGWAYLAGSISAGITIFTLTTWNFTYVGYPVYLLIANFLVYSFIQFRPRDLFSKLSH
ncbi:hypothetical protein HGB07_06800 [Candidatus Roizmanbacteria bacterium]|nr:hypothetical protein [Candidatus Roizmanbacteria bacterium]